MNHKLKHLKLFEGLSTEEIPYSKIGYDNTLNIKIPKGAKWLPLEYNQLTDEITGELYIKHNKHIITIPEFTNLTKVGWYLEISNNESIISITGFNNITHIGGVLAIEDNPNLITINGFTNLKNSEMFIVINNNKILTDVIGFDNLTNIRQSLFIQNNPKLVTMSIPGNLVRAVDYVDDYYIECDNDLKFKSPGDFINSPVIYQDLVTKFNPGEHGDQVIKQIIENVEEWGTEDTKTKVYSLLGKYLTPEQWKLVPTHIQHHYHPDYQGTTGRDVVKVNSGEVYGIF